MNGIKVLSETTETIKVGEYYSFIPSIGSWIGIIVLALLISAIIWAIWKMIDESEILFLLLVFIIVLFGGIIASAVFCHDKMQDRTIYKVIVDDSVSLNEFIKRYEILDIDGDIYIITDKNETLN
jgi:hypothetical protein